LSIEMPIHSPPLGHPVSGMKEIVPTFSSKRRNLLGLVKFGGGERGTATREEKKRRPPYTDLGRCKMYAELAGDCIKKSRVRFSTDQSKSWEKLNRKDAVMKISLEKVGLCA